MALGVASQRGRGLERARQSGRRWWTKATWREKGCWLRLMPVDGLLLTGGGPTAQEHGWAMSANLNGAKPENRPQLAALPPPKRDPEISAAPRLAAKKQCQGTPRSPAAVSRSVSAKPPKPARLAVQVLHSKLCQVDISNSNSHEGQKSPANQKKSREEEVIGEMAGAGEPMPLHGWAVSEPQHHLDSRRFSRATPSLSSLVHSTAALSRPHK